MHTHIRKSALLSFVVMLALLGSSFSPSLVAQQKGTQNKAGQSAGRGSTAKPKPTPELDTAADEANDSDADRPTFARGVVDSAEYLRRRQEWVNYKLGIEPGRPYDPAIREQAINQMRAQEAKIRDDVRAGRISPRVLANSWTNIGPFPIPNGQTQTVTNPVSGRTPSIVVHPTNPDIVYAGAAQGGVYRSTNGGQTWTNIFNSANSQVIGALAISPSNPEIVYVGTGEAGQCGSGCYAGIGVYRIDNASTTADLTGPINPQITTGTTTPLTYNAFMGRSISEILVAPTDPSVVFVATASAIVGNPNASPQGGTIPPLGIRGLYRINNANGPIAGMTISKLTVTTQPGGFDVPSTGNRSILDIAFDPADNTGNTLVAFVNGTAAAGDGGVYRSTNALTTGTFTQTLIPATSNIRGEFGVARTSPVGQSVIYLASGETGTTSGCTAAGQGAVRKSTDGGVTWSARLAGGSGFCGGQCFYDIAIDVSPTDANTVMIGGNVRGTCTRSNGRSTDGGATFPNADVGLHADSHALAFAPSNANRVYAGDDGGVFRSDDGGLTWTSLNNRTYVATQFQSVASHPFERSFVIGGTQDNGTQFLQPNPGSALPYDGWTHSDFGDGGYARIDQTAADTENVTMYHTYFNQTNAQGIGRAQTATDARNKNWTLFGCGFGGAVPNGFDCATTTAVLFYAPFELGPVGVAGAVGQPVYWGTDTLYRSINQAATFVVASQKPIVSGQAISTIAIAPSDDNVRAVGLVNGNVWATGTGLPTLVNVTPPLTAARTVNKIVIDPNNRDVAYVGYGGQFAAAAPATQHIWKTTNLTNATPTWTATANGLPDTPVNTMAVDPANSNIVFAGTDVGIYRSTDAGANWLPYNTGIPVIAIFDMAIQNANRLLRVATHGRGIWEIALDPAVTISGQITGANNSGVTVRLTGSAPAPQTTTTDGSGNYSFTGLTVGGNYTVTPVANGTTAFTPPSRTYPDIPASRTGQNFATTAPPAPIAAPAVVTPGQVLISEFRLRGAGGAADEFVELYNNTDANITVATSDGSEGWALDAAQSDGTTRLTAATIPVGTVIPARAHYLLAAQSYSLTSRASADFYYTPGAAQTDVSDNTGLALYATANRANFASGNRLDAAGFTGAPMQDREGTGLAPIATADADYSFVRVMGTGLPTDTDNNATNFVLVSPSGLVGTTLAVLGAPGPENLSSPIQRNALMRASYIDPTVSGTAAPNRVRNTADTGVNKNFGTLIIRRRFTNNTGQTITRLRFRVVDITATNAFDPGPGVQADVRLLNSSDSSVVTGAGTISVKGTQVGEPPVQPGGGGLNSEANVALTGTTLSPLVAGVCPALQVCTIDVQFTLGVVVNGRYRFLVNVEALP